MGHLGTFLTYLRRTFSSYTPVLFSVLLSGCTLDTMIEALTKENFKLITNIEDNYVDLNSATLNLEGQCDKEEGPITFKLDSVERKKMDCPSSGIWQYALDVHDLGDGEASLVVEQVELADTSKKIKSETVTLNKDTSPPQLLAMPDVILNDKGFVSWDCQNLNDKCTFRTFVSATDLFTFAAEPYTNLKSNMTFPDGKSYLFLQAKDAAGNLSAVKKVEVYSGAMGILINPMQLKLAMAQAVTLRFYIPQLFAEYSLYNNDTCTGADNWQPRTTGTHNWNLPSTTPNLYTVSAKFRTATGVVSQCFTDSIPLIDLTTTFNICTSGSSSAPFGMIGSSLQGQNPGYANNENCNFAVNTTLPMDIMLASPLSTEADKDIFSVRQNSQILYSASGSDAPTGLVTLATTQPSSFTFNFSSDGQNTGTGFVFYWMPKKSIHQEIIINEGALQTSSKYLRVTFDLPSYLKEYYLTEDSSCTAGGTWKTMAAQNQFVSATTGPGTIRLYGRFRDIFGNESECTNKTISYSAPTLAITAPANSNELTSSLDLAGTCSEAGATVRITGTFTGETTCTAQNQWTRSFNLGGTPNNTTINVTAELIVAGNTEASTTRNYTLSRHVTPTSHAANGYVGLTFTLSGTCAPNGSTVNITSPNAAALTCTNGEWSSVQTVSGNDGDLITVAGNLVYQSINQDSFSFQVILSTAPPVAVVKGFPAAISSELNLPMSISGIGISSYRYKFGPGISCSSASGYSAEQSIDLGVTVDQSAYAAGTSVTLCVIGKSGLNGLWQDLSVATTHSWQKASLKYVSLSTPSQVVSDGQTGVVLNVTLSESSPSSVRVYFQTSGDAIYMIDHNLYPGYIEVPAGQTTAQITFDSLTNPVTKDSTLGVYLTHTNKADYFVGENHTKHYMLRDPVRSAQKVISFTNGSDTNPSVTCAVTEDGRLRCWGQQTPTPAGIITYLPAVNFTQVVGNRNHFCALSDQNDMYCGVSGVINTSNHDPGIKYKSIAMRQYIGCGITSDDRVRCWSMDSSFTTKYIDDGVIKFKKVAPSHGTTCAISLTDDLYCYGENTYKTIANNATPSFSVLTLVDSGTKYSDVAAYTYVCGITLISQQLRCWGRNDYYQVGNGTNTATVTPAIIDGTTKYIRISGSNTKACAITDDYKLKCWGKEITGGWAATQTRKLYATPTLLPTNLNWKTVEANEGSICGLADDDLPYCFGDDINYRTAVKGTLDKLALMDSGQYTDYSVNQNSYCTIRNDGAAVCSTYYNSATPRRNPRVIQPFVSFTGGNIIAKKGAMSCISSPTSTYCARNNFFGHLGDGTSTDYNQDFTLLTGTVLKGLTENTYCATGVDADGNLKGWGYAAGSLVCPNTITRQPKNILPAVKFRPVLDSQNLDATCALSLSNEIYCWGSSAIMRGSPNSATPISVDSAYRYTDFKVAGTRVCGILETSGQLRCWGNNSNGRLGNNSTTLSSGTAVTGGHSYSKLDMNDNITCALRGTTLDCWGGTATHNSLVPFAVNGGASYKDFAVTAYTVVAVTTGGQVHIWDGGLFKDAPRVISPAGVSFKSIKSSADNQLYCALSTDDRLYCRDLDFDYNMHLHQVKEARF